MARLSTTQTVETTVDVQLAPEVQAQLEGNLSTYNELKAQAQLIADAMDEEKTAIWEIMKENGVSSMKVGDCTMTDMSGQTTSSINWKQIFADRTMTEAQKANYTVRKPKKAYLDIRGSDELL